MMTMSKSGIFIEDFCQEDGCDYEGDATLSTPGDVERFMESLDRVKAHVLQHHARNLRRQAGEADEEAAKLESDPFRPVVCPHCGHGFRFRMCSRAEAETRCPDCGDNVLIVDRNPPNGALKVEEMKEPVKKAKGKKKGEV